MIDKDMPCRKDCPGRTVECKKTCPGWAKWEAKKQESYAERMRRVNGNPISYGAQKNAAKNKINVLKGRGR